MSKVIKHTRVKIATEKAGHKVRTEHEHFPQGKTGMVPHSSPDVMTAEDIKKSKR